MSSDSWQPLDAPRQPYLWHGHRIAYYSSGSGRPLLLVHSINAAASALEMRAPFAGLRDEFQVFAIDLLGYGGSERPAKIYSAEEYAELLADFTRDVVGEGAAVIASSLGAAYTVRAAARYPGRFGRLVLVCPTGIKALARPAKPGPAYALLRGPIGSAIFAGLTSRASIAYFLRRQSYADPAKVDDALITGFYGAAHAPGAKYAPICFLTGLLNCDIRADFGKLRQQILLVWGKDSDITPPSQAKGFLKRNKRARLELFDRAKLSVQDEHPEAFNRLARAFLCE